MRFSRLERSVEWGALASLIVIIAILGGLVKLGIWQGDEFVTGANIASDGFKALYQRVTAWSPRPFSEIMLFAYHSAVIATGDRLIPWFLSLLWGGMLVATLWPAMLARSDQRAGMAIFMLSLLLLVIAGRHNSEAIFWTQGAVAYIPTIAGALLAHGAYVIANDAKRLPNAAYLGLLICALSSETGAFLGVTASLALAVTQLSSSKTGREISKTGILAIFVTSTAVLVAMFLGRGTSSSEVMGHGDPAIAGNVVMSLGWAFYSFAVNLFLFGSNVENGLLRAIGLPTKIVLFCSCMLLFRHLKLQMPAHLAAAWGTAFFAAAFLTMAASYYKFGVIGAERHITMESGLIFIGLTAFAIAAAANMKVEPPHVAGVAGVIGLFGAATIPVAVIAPAIAYDYQHADEIVATRDLIWETGKSDDAHVVAANRRTRGIVGTLPMDVGSHTREGQADWVKIGIFKYFKKNDLEVISR
ncbi:hypothetical protein G6L37_04830 [Agrobacterium rubi]|nr:hypothetical protein [Agrobacterium rubi]NTF24679.1 hypothetical protein [Agrobacterium rubi]